MSVVKYVIVLGLMWAIPIAAIAQDNSRLKIGVDGTFPPFSHKNLDGVYSGFDIELAQILCKKMKSKCAFVQLKWEGLIPALQNDKVDLVVATLRPNEINSALVSFSEPYLQIPSVLVVRKDTILSGTNVENLQNAQLGTLSSSTHAEYLRVHYPASHVKTYQKQSEYFKDLVEGTLDGIVAHPILLDQWLKSPGGSACCMKLGAFPHDPDINGKGYAIGVGNKRSKLLAQINKALKSIAKSGKLAKITKTHLPIL